jgi:pimeloyl-ACP methyl ester carboxylesterase
MEFMKCFAVYALLIVSLAGCGIEFVDNTPKNFLAEREDFTTQILPNNFKPAGIADWPPESDFEPVFYDADDGKLLAYLSPDPGDGEKHPAVLWAKGGFGGIGSFLWEEAPAASDHSVRAFLDAGIVTMCPSWRGENSNPGRYEMFYGELNDLLDALRYLKKVPYVDPDRIYLAGHSSGGTLALLGAVATDEFRAVFSFGGAPDIGKVVQDGVGYGNTPFDINNEKEILLRSALEFTHEIRSRTFYFEGLQASLLPETKVMSHNAGDARKMSDLAYVAGVPFEIHFVKNGNHINYLQFLTRRLAKKIQYDNGPACKINITQYDVLLPAPRDRTRISNELLNLRQ